MQSGQAALGGLGGRRNHAGVAEIPVDQGRRIVQFDVNPGGGEEFGIPNTVVAERVMPGDGHIGRGQPGQIRCASGSQGGRRIG